MPAWHFNRAPPLISTLFPVDYSFVLRCFIPEYNVPELKGVNEGNLTKRSLEYKT
jgi:hypothetical protein